MSSSSSAAAPSPVWHAMVSPVSRAVIAAARTNLRSTSWSGPRFTPVLMKRGFHGSRASAIHRRASCSAVSDVGELPARICDRLRHTARCWSRSRCRSPRQPGHQLRIAAQIIRRAFQQSLTPEPRDFLELRLRSTKDLRGIVPARTDPSAPTKSTMTCSCTRILFFGAAAHLRLRRHRQK
jgi:hypothetical protein